MSGGEFKSWQSVQAEVLRRINAREWKPGDFIPNESELSVEFGCARATVNRALRGLAESGLLDRRRKAGTRVALNPVRKATLDIPVIRYEIEGKGQSYRHSVLSLERMVPPSGIRARMQTQTGVKLLHLVTLHLADGKPYVFGDRWINPDAVPGIEKADLSAQSANEWLVANIPFEGGDFSFSAMTAGKREAEILACKEGEGLFVIERSTWNKSHVITSVRLTFAPGYRMHTQI
ncbi:GntR family transcriptional regulator [Hoeflea alexandrii]|uniref:GntR family transcriptional regulator n=2 Tax=Hoeflea alexandrii TaxID=288436 RepID=UPI00209439A3|nr:GntR family transcriptional regulator [Hoeflea alexandrii]